MEQKTLTRKQLYELAWKKPQILDTYGILL